MISPSAPVRRSQRQPAGAARLTGVSARFVLLEGSANGLEPISPAPSLAELARGAVPTFAMQSAATDLPILEQFAADLATAPEIVGELVALYAEQYPRLTIAFVAQAVKRVASASDDVEAAARRREVGGFAELAELIYAALDCVLPQAAGPAPPPPVIVDIEFLDRLDAASRR